MVIYATDKRNYEGTVNNYPKVHILIGLESFHSKFIFNYLSLILLNNARQC